MDLCAYSTECYTVEKRGELRSETSSVGIEILIKKKTKLSA